MSEIFQSEGFQIYLLFQKINLLWIRTEFKLRPILRVLTRRYIIYNIYVVLTKFFVYLTWKMITEW